MHERKEVKKIKRGRNKQKCKTGGRYYHCCFSQENCKFIHNIKLSNGKSIWEHLELSDRDKFKNMFLGRLMDTSRSVRRSAANVNKTIFRLLPISAQLNSLKTYGLELLSESAKM